MITPKDVEHVAKLARLALTEEERRLYTGQLSKILDFFAQLEEVDTVGVEPMSHPLPVVNVLREDEVTEAPDHELLLAAAPEREGDFFRVPRISE